MHRYITGYLWRFAIVRSAVFWYVSAGLPGTLWLATETPLMVAVRQLHLEAGNLDQAAICTQILRESGDV